MKKIQFIEDTKLGTERIMFNGKVEELKQHYVRFEDLIFNPLNTRVKDKINTKFPNLKADDSDVFSQEVQEYIYETLKKDHNKTINKRLTTKLESGQTEPLIITETGIIISGNNRYSLIKSAIIDDDNERIRKNFEKTIVAVIEGDLTPKDIIEWEISTQKETDLKLNYEEMNLIMRVKELNESGTPMSKIMTIMAIEDEKEITRYIEMADLYDKFLMYAGVPNRKDLHREISVYSYLDGLYSQIKKGTTKPQEKKLLPKIYFDVILGSELPVQKFRDLVGKVVGNNTIDVEDRVKLLKYVDTNITEKLEPVIEKIKSDKYTKKSIEENRMKLSDEDFSNFFDKVQEKVKTTVDFKKNQKKSNFASVQKQLQKALEVYEQVDEIRPTTIAYSYSESEIKELKNTLKEHSKFIKELIEKI